ncbi:MAG: O-antigen ligase family protein [Clostridia bacterium]|nr:O-antigen ligase family protein [Clostridia bacterium]
MFKQKLKEILSDDIWILILLTIGFLGWLINIDFITMPLLGILSLLIFLICDDIKNVFAIVISIPFFINSINTTFNIIMLGIALLFFVIGLLFFIIKQIIKKSNFTKGKMFWATIIYLIAHLLGGFIGHFNIIHSIVILLMVLLTYAMYWLALNFTTNLKRYFQLLFITLGVILSVQLLIEYFKVDQPFHLAILSKNIVFIGVQNINIAAIYFIFAMLSVLTLGFKHKYDYLFSLASLIFAICTYFTYSRMGTLTCFILLFAALLYTFIKSSNKKIYLGVGLTFLLIAILTTIIFYDRIIKLLDWYISLGFKGNGRDELYPWCFEKFIENPLFGIGFVADETVPTMLMFDNIILAHNTILQYLTSLGIVGSIMMIYYHYKEYKIAFTKFNDFKFFNLLQILTITIFGMAATKDIFLVILLTFLIVLSEKDADNSIIYSTQTQHNRKMKKEKYNEKKEGSDTIC